MRGRLEKRSKDSWTIIIEKGRHPLTNKRQRICKTVKGAKREAERQMHYLLQLLETP